MDTYRNREVVTAYQVAEPGEAVNTRTGLQWAPTGAWVVFGATGVVIRADEEFTARYAVWDANVPAVAADADLVFTPVGQTVEQVIAYLDANPGDVGRVQDIERQGSGRKGIMEYA